MFALGVLGIPQLLVVSVVLAAANIAFRAASGAYLNPLVRPEDLVVANGRFESTTWTATALGPPLGGAAIGPNGGWSGRPADPADPAPAPASGADAQGAGGGQPGWSLIVTTGATVTSAPSLWSLL